MATVVISDRIVNQVRHAVSLLYKEKIEAAEVTPSHWGTMFYEAAIPGELLEKMKALPKSYFYKFPNRVLVYSHGMSLSVYINGDNESITPIIFDWEVNGCKGNPTSVEINTNDPRWEGFIQEYKEWRDKKQAAYDEREQAVKNAITILRTWRTLAPALKAWPPLWELLDQSTKDRHLQKVEKQTRKRELPDMVGLGNLTTRVVAKRLTGK